MQTLVGTLMIASGIFALWNWEVTLIVVGAIVVVDYWGERLKG